MTALAEASVGPPIGSATTASAESRLVAGRYRLVEPLGRGGMGRVYLARDELLDRPVALKLIYDDSVRDRDVRHACAREARAAARLNHPNIVHILDSGFDDDGHLYVVMQLAAGRTLAEILRESGALTPTRALDLAAQVADALDAAHQQGVIHCDVKPGNLIVDDHDHVRLVDFGIARVTTSTTGLSNQLLEGSAKYAAPEQIEGATVDGRTDQYALGVVLYEMLTGEPPFVGSSVASLLAQRLNNDPPSVRDLVPALSPQIDEIVRRAMAREPAERLQSAGSLRDALRAARSAPLAGAIRPDTGRRSATAFVQSRFRLSRRRRQGLTDALGGGLRATTPVLKGVLAALARSLPHSLDVAGLVSPSLRTALALAALIGLVVGVSAARCGTAGLSAEPTFAASPDAAAVPPAVQPASPDVDSESERPDPTESSDDPESSTPSTGAMPQPSQPSDSTAQAQGPFAPPPVVEQRAPTQPIEAAPVPQSAAPAQPGAVRPAQAVAPLPAQAAGPPPQAPEQPAQSRAAPAEPKPNGGQSAHSAPVAKPAAPPKVEMKKQEQAPPPGRGGPPRGNGNGGSKGKGR